MTTNSMASFPSAAAAPDIRDVKAPLNIFSPEMLLLWLGIAAALALIAWMLWKKLRRREASAAAAAPALSPHDKARQQLERSLQLINEPKEFCTVISNVIRVYFEERFDLHAPERTTEEFLDEIQASPFLSFEQKGLLADFLAQCDLVKFARNEPTQDQLHALHRIAVRLVEETHPPTFAPAQTGEAKHPHHTLAP